MANALNQEVSHFTKVNANLALIVDDLRLKSQGMNEEMKKLKQTLEVQESEKKEFKEDVFQALQSIGEYKRLKKSCVNLYKKHSRGEKHTEGGTGADIAKEFAGKVKWQEDKLSIIKKQIA